MTSTKKISSVLAVVLLMSQAGSAFAGESQPNIVKRFISSLLWTNDCNRDHKSVFTSVKEACWTNRSIKKDMKAIGTVLKTAAVKAKDGVVNGVVSSKEHVVTFVKNNPKSSAAIAVAAVVTSAAAVYGWFAWNKKSNKKEC